MCASKSESLLYEYALGSKFGMLVRISFPSAGTEIVAFLCSAMSVVMCALSASNDGKAAVCKGVWAEMLGCCVVFGCVSVVSVLRVFATARGSALFVWGRASRWWESSMVWDNLATFEVLLDVLACDSFAFDACVKAGALALRLAELVLVAVSFVCLSFVVFVVCAVSYTHLTLPTTPYV